MAQHHEQDDVTVRDIPQTRYAAIGWLVLALFLAAMTAWELKMRSLGLRTTDRDDSPSHWAVERRKIEDGEHDGVVIVGSSRILFDTDLGVWREMTGRTPVQLALPGTSPRPYLASVAEDTDFAGLVICDVTPEMFFSPFIGALPQFVGMQDTWRDETPSEKFGHQVDLRLQPVFAFLENEYSLFRLIERIVVENDRVGADGPYYDVWKLSEVFENRQYFLWHRVEQPGFLQQHARAAWGPFGDERPPLKDEHIDASIADVFASVAKIRARGGQVVFIRPPSAGPFLERENRSAPRAKTWDRLLRETGAFGIHFEDHETTRGLEVPEWSHLSRRDAARFTRAYVGVLRERYVWLRTSPVLEPAG
ncbi:MAG TPA: hypothetical protein VFU77_00840 [Steroidobacteraceae bacterium]|nr:hypothetical protein [Steroidobacteraceae bacterium]